MENQTIPTKCTNQDSPDPKSIRIILTSLRLSILEGSFANVFGNLTGSVFLPAFALALGAGPFEIGIIAAIPLVSSAGQFGGSYLIEKLKKTKPIVVTTAFISRNLWIPFIIISIIFAVKEPAYVLKALMITLLFYHFFGAVLGVSWFSWISRIIPDQIRGRYFGLRNIIMGGIGLLFVLLGGYFLDWYIGMVPAGNRFNSFHILFGIAVIFGLISTLLLIKQPDLYKPSGVQHSLVSLFKKPFSDINFMKLIRFGILWSFSLNIAFPFFIVFMLQDLKLSYMLVAGYTISASCMELLGMWIWGHVSDHTANKPVIVISGSILALLPLAWLLVDSNHFSIFFFIPFLQVTGGFFGAGFNLCSVNLLLRMAPTENNSVYISYWNGFNIITTGLGALLGGFLAKISSPLVLPSLLMLNSSYKFIFLFSSMLRIGAVFFLRGIREPKGIAVIKVIQSLRAMQLWVPLWFFLPRSHPEGLCSPYWPIWKSKRKVQFDEIEFSIDEG